MTDAFEQAIEDSGDPQAQPVWLDVEQAATAAIAWFRTQQLAYTPADVANMASMILRQQESRLIRRELEGISGRLGEMTAAVDGVDMRLGLIVTMLGDSIRRR